MMDNDTEMGPVNIGNPTEFTMLELAKVRPALCECAWACIRTVLYFLESLPRTCRWCKK